MSNVSEVFLQEAKKENAHEGHGFMGEIILLLSRLASLQGDNSHKHQFEALVSDPLYTNTQDNYLTKTKEAWLTFFPEGEARQLEHKATVNDMPLLWIANDAKDAKILKGVISNGNFSAQNMDGIDTMLSSKDFQAGKILSLKTKIASNLSHKKPTSAKGWFIYAIKKRRGPFVESIVASVVVSLLALGVSFYSMQVYDRVIPTQTYATLIVITVGVLIAVGLELITKQVRSSILDRACKAIDLELSDVFFGRMLSIRMDARPKTVGTFASQIKQFEVVRNFMTSSTLFLLADAPFVLFFILVIWSIGGIVAIVPLGLLPISIMIGLYTKWKIGDLAEDQANETNQKNGLLVEAIDGIESIKAVGGEWKMLEHWKQLTQKTASKELTSRSITSFATSASQTVQQLSYVLMVAIGAYAVGSGKITMGALMACSIISNRALSPIAQIASKIVQWQSAKAALKGLDEMMKLPVDTQDGMEMTILEDMQGKIQLDQVAFAYQGNQVVFKHPQLVIKPGERVAIIGTIGSGKSTLIKLLSGLYKPTEGKVFLDDVDMHHISPVFLRESIGYLTQDIRLFNGTLRYNLTIGLQSPSDSKILSACEKTGLIQIIKQHPKGLDLPIFEGGRGLSGGQRQLVGLTRMLLLKPKILLLDEPTASIDGELEQTILKVLFTEADPQSVILLSTHKLALLKYVERVIVLDRGKIRFDGPRAEVIAKLKGQP